PLLPPDPDGRARVRAVSRFVDLYLEPSLYVLFPQVLAAEKDHQLIATTFVTVGQRLDQLTALLGPGPYAVGSSFTLADCSLAPVMLYTQLTLQILDGPPFTDGRPRLAAWWTNVQQRPSVQRVHGEMMEWVMKMQPAAGAALASA